MVGINYRNAEQLEEQYLSPERLRTFVFDVDLSGLDEGYRRAIPKLLRALEVMDTLFLLQDHPESLSIKNRLLRDARRGVDGAQICLDVFNIFNGPEGVTYSNEVVPLFQNVMERPKGGTVYTPGITAEEIDAYLEKYPEKRDEFEKINTAISRTGDGLGAVKYEHRYRRLLWEARNLLLSAAEDVLDEKFAKYLKSRAEALVSGDYFKSDVDFVRSTDGPIDLIIGPLESYRDLIKSRKAFYAGLLCMKNPEESTRVSKYVEYLPDLENLLPQDRGAAKDMSKVSMPVLVVDVIAMSGDYQAKRPGIIFGQTLPNDKNVIKEVGRKLFVYRNILMSMPKNPEVISRLIDPGIQKYIAPRGEVNFVVGHEVSHSLGPKETGKNGDEKREDIRTALGAYSGIIEELKADLLAVYNLPHLVEKGLYSEDEAREVHLSAFYRSIPYAKPTEKDTHDIGTLMRFNYYLADGGVTLRDEKFSVDFDKLRETTRKMLQEVLSIQTEGSQARAKEFVDKWSAWTPEAKYTSGVIEECKVKLYKKVEQPTAEKLLRS